MIKSAQALISKLNFLRDSSSLKRLAIRGAIWTVSAYGLSQVIRLVSNLILTRLLAPELFGLMSLVTTFLIGIHLFSDIGIHTNIIQSKRGEDPVFLNTAWTVQVIRGFVIWLICLAVSWPLSQLYNNPEILWLIPVVGATSLITGFYSTSLPTLNRKLIIGRLTLFEQGTQIFSTIVTIVAAWLTRSIWAFVIGNLAAAAAQTILSHYLFPSIKNRFAWEREALKEIVSFGKWIFVSTSLTFLAEQTDRLILGKLFSLDLLGVYSIAYIFADMPRSVLMAVSSKVIFPAYSQAADAPRSTFREKIKRNRWPILIVAAFGLALLVSFGDFLILKLFDPRYARSAVMLPVLALGIWPRILTETIDPALLAVGQPRYLALGNALKLLFNVSAIPLGFYLLGAPGSILAIAFNDVPFYGAVIYGLWKEDLLCSVQEIGSTALLILFLGLFLLLRIVLGFDLPSFSLS